MKLLINKNTFETIQIEAFLRNNKNLSVNPTLVSQDVVDVVDPDLRLVEVEEPPQYIDKFELVELSKPVIIDGEPVVFWEIKRTSKEAINEYYNEAIEGHLDSIARGRGWKNQDRLISNMTSTILEYEQEARYFRQLVDRSWAIALPLINSEVALLMSDAAHRPLPVSELIAQLPHWNMPAGF